MKKKDMVKIINEQQSVAFNNGLRRLIKEALRDYLKDESKPKRFVIQTRTGAYYFDVDYPNSIDYDHNTRLLGGYVGNTPVSVKVGKEDFENLANNCEHCEAEFSVLDNDDFIDCPCVLSCVN